MGKQRGRNDAGDVARVAFALDGYEATVMRTSRQVQWFRKKSKPAPIASPHARPQSRRAIGEPIGSPAVLSRDSQA